MANELRKLRQASTHATHQQEELLRAKKDLSEARRQIKSLQVRAVHDCVRFSSFNLLLYAINLLLLLYRCHAHRRSVTVRRSA